MVAKFRPAFRLIGFSINLLGMNPIQTLYYAAVLNGMVEPPLLLMIVLIGNNHNIMKDRANSRVSNALGGWITTVVMAVAAVALIVSLLSNN